MNKKLDILSVMHDMNIFSTSMEIAEKLDASDFAGKTDFDKKKSATNMSTHLNHLCTAGYVVKIQMPAVATFWGLSKWVDGLFPKDEYLPEQVKKFKCDFVLLVKENS